MNDVEHAVNISPRPGLWKALDVSFGQEEGREGRAGQSRAGAGQGQGIADCFDFKQHLKFRQSHCYKHISSETKGEHQLPTCTDAQDKSAASA